VFHGNEDIGPAFPGGDRLRHVGATHFIDLIGDDRSIVQLGCVQRDAARASRSPASPVGHGGGSREPQQSAIAPITCG
jgi:hypothetical protein